MLLTIAGFHMYMNIGNSKVYLSKEKRLLFFIIKYQLGIYQSRLHSMHTLYYVCAVHSHYEILESKNFLI